MKNVIYAVIIIAIAAAIFLYIDKQKEAEGIVAANNIENDYAKIDSVNKAMAKLAKSKSVRSFSNQAQWYIFDLRTIYEKEEGFYKDLKKELGDDFDTQLSNGDYLFVGVLPVNQSYRVYAGAPQYGGQNPDIDSSLLYPKWNYEKMEKR